ncbi:MULTISPECIES: hypothetical protein [Xanthomonas]|nr:MULTISPECIES: hypothetical protein [Xanthomonas]MBB5735267.1 hypothetical protein [Xanthomonas sp. CFBP 8152]
MKPKENPRAVPADPATRDTGRDDPLADHLRDRAGSRLRGHCAHA